MTDLRVGDKVMWRGSWGSDPAQVATVEAIDRCERPRDKYGDPVESIPWSDIDYACVSLDNGHWAYGEQLSPAPISVENRNLSLAWSDESATT